MEDSRALGPSTDLVRILINSMEAMGFTKKILVNPHKTNPISSSVHIKEGASNVIRLDKRSSTPLLLLKLGVR